MEDETTGTLSFDDIPDVGENTRLIWGYKGPSSDTVIRLYLSAQLDEYIEVNPGAVYNWFQHDEGRSPLIGLAVRQGAIIRYGVSYSRDMNVDDFVCRSGSELLVPYAMTATSSPKGGGKGGGKGGSTDDDVSMICILGASLGRACDPKI